MDQLSSRRPYLIRALYEWVLENDCTPHLLVAADAPGVAVPSQFITEDGRITINVSPSAIRDLHMGNDWITFSARFSGRGYNISFPPGAVLALYARENGEGMLFGDPEVPPEPEASTPVADTATSTDTTRSAVVTGDEQDKPRPSHLRVVK